MGKIFTGVNGGFFGKVGSVIGASWRSINYMRGLSKPSDRTPTEKQQAQRLRFSITVKFLKQIRDLLNSGYANEDTSKATGYNLAVRETLLHAIKGDYPDYSIDYPKVVLSKGSLYGTTAAHITSTEVGKVDVSWKCVLNDLNSFAGDKVMVVLYNPAKKLFVTDSSSARQAEKVTIDVTSDFTGDSVYCWLYFTSQEKKRLSETVYAGEILVY